MANNPSYVAMLPTPTEAYKRAVHKVAVRKDAEDGQDAVMAKHKKKKMQNKKQVKKKKISAKRWKETRT